MVMVSAGGGVVTAGLGAAAFLVAPRTCPPANIMTIRVKENSSRINGVVNGEKRGGSDKSAGPGIGKPVERQEYPKESRDGESGTKVRDGFRVSERLI